MGEQYKRSQMLQRDLAASLKDSKEALHREVEIMAQLEAQDEVQHLLLQLLCVCVRAATELCCHCADAVASQHKPLVHIATWLALARPAHLCIAVS